MLIAQLVKEASVAVRGLTVVKAVSVVARRSTAAILSKLASPK